MTNIVRWIPTELKIYHHKKNCIGQWVCHSQLLVVDNVNQWVEHRTLGSNADFIALPLTELDNVDLYFVDPVNTLYAKFEGDNNTDFLIGPSDNVSIVGFPFGKSTSGHMPIWVTGFLASELNENYRDLPIQLVDSRTRPGQSGSPVFAYRSGGAIPTKQGEVTIYSGPVAKFIGIYSGRINDISDIGMVWKASALAELISAINSSA